MTNSDTAHERRVKSIQAQVAGYYHNGTRAKIFHGATNSTRPPKSTGLSYIDVSDLTNIVRVDREGEYVLAEPNVPFDALVSATLAHGMIPPMVPEFPGITVGGALQGGSGESSSFKWGLFHEICPGFEIITGDGRLISVSPTDHPDLYAHIPCSYGSLAVVTLIKIRLVPATTHVRLTYYKTVSAEDTVTQLSTHRDSSADFVDGILFAPNHGVVMVGKYTNKTNMPETRFGRKRDEWFYLHAQAKSASHDMYEEIIPLREYVFRYDRGGFWVASNGFHHVPFNRFTRLLFSGIFTTRRLYKLLHLSYYAYIYFAQDLCLPEDKVTTFIDYCDDNLGIYPLWLCPLKTDTMAPLSPSALKTPRVINVGVWGEMKPSEDSPRTRNRKLEKFVQKLGGRKVLYAHAYYPEKEFWEIYNRASYDKARKTCQAERVFPTMYEKVKTLPAPEKPSKYKGFRALCTNPYKKPQA